MTIAAHVFNGKLFNGGLFNGGLFNGGASTPSDTLTTLISSLFGSGEQGTLYLPSLSTCYTDNGTTLCTAPGNLVYRIDDLSGNGHHATQATESKRPVLRESGGLYYLEFDGAEDALQTASIDFSGSNEMSVFAGVTKKGTVLGNLVELSASITSNTGAFVLSAPTGANDRYGYNSKGTVLASAFVIGYTAPTTNILTGISKISTDYLLGRVDGADSFSSSGDQGSGNYGNHALNIGARNGSLSYFNGNLFALIIRGAVSTPTEVTDTESFIAEKTGVTL